jgi:hypothetical protein
MLYGIEPADVKSVELADGWHRAKYLTVTGTGRNRTFNFRDLESGVTVAGPVSSIIAIMGPPVETAEEAAERIFQEEQRALYAARLFEWRTYTDQDSYLEAFDRQDGLCGKCGCALSDQPIVHMYNAKLLCRGCSPLQPRFGSPS